MRTNHRVSTPNGERGAATIFVTIVLLLAVGLIALYTNRAAVMEQRLTANEIRAKQALAAANAGIDAALSHWHVSNINIPTTIADAVLTTELSNGGGQKSWYQSRYYRSDLGAAIPPCPVRHTTAMLLDPKPTSLLEIRVVSCGWSDDDTSVQRVSQIIAPSDSTGGQVETPLIAKGTADLLTGGATVMNYFNDLTVWSGGSLLGQSMTGKSFVRNVADSNHVTVNPAFVAAVNPDPNYRDTDNSPACNTPPTGYECSTQGGKMGHDTVTGDTNLSSKTKAEFFSYLFGKDMASYKAATTTKVLSGADTSSLVGMKNQVVWIEGDATLPGGASGVIGATKSLGPPAVPAAPVIIIVNGNLNLASFNGEINGLLYVHGNVTGTGSPTIYGAMVVAGNATANGNIKIIYDPLGLKAAEKIGKAARVPGTWADF